jgi:hypothetical protein
MIERSEIKENKNLAEKDCIIRIPLSKLVPMIKKIMKSHPKDMEMLK